MLHLYAVLRVVAGRDKICFQVPSEGINIDDLIKKLVNLYFEELKNRFYASSAEEIVERIIKYYLIYVNGKALPKEGLRSQIIYPGDEVKLIEFMAGG